MQQKNLLNMVLVSDPNLRLSLEDIKQDPYFKEIKDWDNLEEILTEEHRTTLNNRLMATKKTTNSELS